ncbi:MAG: cation:proton antiporter [Desulfovibrionaceae bacterium]|nr:cation:proton antiporter [Desulfovibrionaceae bacterium]
MDQAASLFLVCLAAALLPGLGRLLRLPTSVAEILFGVVLGKSLLDLDLGGQWLPFLAELGFLLLMFQAGMEIDFAMLKAQGRSRLGFQLVFFGATLGLAGLASFFLGHGLFLALVLSTTSLGLVMTVLRETRLSRTPLGQTILVASTLADFLTLFGITFFVLWGRYGLTWRFIQPLPLFFGFGLVIWLARMWAWWHPEKAARLLLSEDAQEQGVRLCLALLFLFVAASELVDLEPVLGAFMGGCIISFVFREKGLLGSKISALGFGFLVPIFFIHVGMGFEASNVLGPGRPVFLLALLGCALVVKVLPGLLFPLWGLGLGDGLRAGLLLSSRLSLIVAAAAIGLQEGFLDPEMKDVIVLLALLTCFLGPLLFRLSLGRRTRARLALGAAED